MESREIWFAGFVRIARSVRSIHFMEQHIAAVAGVDDGIGGRCVTGDHNGAPRRFKTVAEGLVPRTVLHQKGFYDDVVVF